MRVILKRSSIANSEATDLLSQIESKKAEMEKLSLFLSRRKDMRKTRASNLKMAKERLEKGNFLHSDLPKLQAEIQKLEPLLAESEKDLEVAQKDFDKGKGELDSLVKKFDTDYLVLNYEQSSDIKS